MLDIDYFKKFNDQYGHQVGDEVLRIVGSHLKKNLKGKDIPSRYGGEEFTVILPETVGAEAETVAQRLRITVENESFAPETVQVVPITISVGVTEYNPKEDIATFIQRADQAMYMSKQEGRNKVTCLFGEETA